MKHNLLMNLISIRVKAMVRNLGKGLPGRRTSKWTAALLVFLMLYLVVAFEAMFVMLWSTLSLFCTVGLTWLYFSLCGILSLFLTVFMTVFMTENQMYNASDNELLLAMPIPSRTILLSRMAVLLGSSLLTVVMITAPAVGVYLYKIGALTPLQWLGIFASVFALTLTAQAISCLLGFVLHLILRRVRNKAVGSMVFMILFLVVYVTLYSKMGDIISYLATNGETVASAIQAWAAPIYSLGLACSGEWLHSLLLIVGSALIFAAVCAVLSHTFLKAVKGNRGKSAGYGKKVKVGEKTYRRRSPADAVFAKELRKLVTCPIYLTNIGIGVIMIAAAAVASPFLKGKIEEMLVFFPWIAEYYPLFVPTVICLLNGMSCFTAPSVSLEGKNLWVMRSMPISGRDVLLGKLKLHLVLTGTVSTAAGLVIAITFGCGVAETVLITVLSLEVAALSGILGLIYNLLMPNFKWINEAVPCKQGMPVLFSMLSSMGLPVIAGVVYYLVRDALSPAVYLGVLCVVLLIGVGLLLRLTVGWGAKRFESFQC